MTAFAPSVVPVSICSISRSNICAFPRKRHNIKQRRTPVSTLEQTAPVSTETEPNTVERKEWYFRGFRLEYISASSSECSAETPCIILVHGFGANCLHFRKNVQPLADAGYRVFAVDLIGFGLGDKPAPGSIDKEGNTVEYTFPYWSEQLRAFISEIVQPQGELYAVSNSIGCVASLQACTDSPGLIRGHVLISPSLRLLNVRKRNWFQGLSAQTLQNLLSIEPVGAYFLGTLSKPETLRSVLKGAYPNEGTITPELLSLLREPALTPGALAVFLAFIKYDEGPIPEDLLPNARAVSIIWGGEDGFEPLNLGRALGDFETVRTFEVLPGLGHCAHDEAPKETNAAILKALKTVSE